MPTPEPGPGEVSIDVTHAGANFAEVRYRQGLVDVPLPFVPGIEAAAGSARSARVRRGRHDRRRPRRAAAQRRVRACGRGAL
ncbi:hypothetical protein [Amycolatopsis sp. cmx-4-83]|uniref:hypothetical protein n=1 Tax=Amycolatopsis sp. cmx-4-83 TaxID=2790940 RepID=UPI00397B1C3C